MAASLGAGILSLAGGIEGLGGFSGVVPLRWAIAALIVASFLISAATGLQKGIAGLSVLNTWLFFAIIAFVLVRSEEHTSELQSLMRISYAVFCLKKKKIIIQQ